LLTKPVPRPPLHQRSILYSIHAALIAAGARLEVPVWPIDYDPGVRAMRDADTGSLPDDPRQWFHWFTVPDIGSWPPGWSVRSAPPSKKSAYRDLVGLVERARGLVDEAHLGPAEVAAMLIEARAPLPAADNLSRLAADCLCLSLNHVCRDRLFDWSARQRGWSELNAAADTLRQLLPEAIKELKYLGRDRRIPPINQVLKRLNKLDLTMPDVPRAPARRPWAEGATSLAETYRETVDPGAGWSRNGPAVRFLGLALNRAYPGCEVTGAAIATELLDRVRRRSPNTSK
jgi:hypothetical protein